MLLWNLCLFTSFIDWDAEFRICHQWVSGAVMIFHLPQFSVVLITWSPVTFCLIFFFPAAHLTPPTRGWSQAVLHINEGRQMLGSLGWYPPHGWYDANFCWNTSRNKLSAFGLQICLPFFMNGIDLGMIIPRLIRHKSCAWPAAVVASGRRCSVCLSSCVLQHIDRWPVLTRCPLICSGQAALNPMSKYTKLREFSHFPPLVSCHYFYCSPVVHLSAESNGILANSFIFVCALLREKEKTIQ